MKTIIGRWVSCDLRVNCDKRFHRLSLGHRFKYLKKVAKDGQFGTGYGEQGLFSKSSTVGVLSLSSFLDLVVFSSSTLSKVHESDVGAVLAFFHKRNLFWSGINSFGIFFMKRFFLVAVLRRRERNQQFHLRF